MADQTYDVTSGYYPSPWSGEDGGPRRLQAVSGRQGLPTHPNAGPSISRLSAWGNTVYVTGVRTIYRYAFDVHSRTLALDDSWSLDYVGNYMQSAVFPAPGWARDFYWLGLDRLTRIAVEKNS